MKVLVTKLKKQNRLRSKRINGYRKQDTSVDAASHLYFYHDCIHPAQVENKGLDMVSFFFPTDSRFVFFRTPQRTQWYSRQTRVCQYVTQDCTLWRTLTGSSASQSSPWRQPSPNQLTFEPSATTWGPRVTVSQLKDNVHHALFDRQMQSCRLASVHCGT